MSTEKTTPAPVVKVDLRDGYRIEVTPMILPEGEFGARLQTRVTSGDRTRWKDIRHPVVIANTPEQAQADLTKAMNTGKLAGVEVSG